MGKLRFYIGLFLLCCGSVSLAQPSAGGLETGSVIEGRVEYNDSAKREIMIDGAVYRYALHALTTLPGDRSMSAVDLTQDYWVSAEVKDGQIIRIYVMATGH